jgi:hypothetical protein
VHLGNQSTPSRPALHSAGEQVGKALNSAGFGRIRQMPCSASDRRTSPGWAETVGLLQRDETLRTVGSDQLSWLCILNSHAAESLLRC